MSWKVLRHLFNCPPNQHSMYITDKRNRKFWFAWYEAQSMLVWYRGRPIGKVDIAWEKASEVVLAYIGIEDPKLRRCGLGKAMLNETFCRVKEYGANYIWGWIQPAKDVSLEYLVVWYRQQGFEVVNRDGRYLIERQL